MPEGPECRVVADAVAKGIGTIFNTSEIVENVSGTLHRYSRERPENWNIIADSPWKLVDVRTKGKLIIFDILSISSDTKWCLLTTLGMSGDYRWNDAKNKHCRFSFIQADGHDLSFIDARCFGSLRIVTPEKAKQLEAKIGWDLLKAPMLPEKWAQLQNNASIKDEEVKVALLTQNLASGLGNIYVCETLYQTGIDPKAIVSKIDPKKWAEINLVAHDILVKAYKLNGSSVKDYTFDGKKGEAQNMLKVYGRTKCPQGHLVQKFEQNKRTTWWVPEIQKH